MLRGYVGKILETVTAEVASREGIPFDEPVGLTLGFAEAGELCLGAGGDGESIRVGRFPSPAFPEDEREIAVERQDQTAADQWMPFVGRRCEDVLEVRDMTWGGRGAWIGLEFAFEGGARLAAYNWGDAFVCLAPPEDTGALERRSVLRRPEDDEGGEGGDRDRGRFRHGRGEGRGDGFEGGGEGPRDEPGDFEGGPAPDPVDPPAPDDGGDDPGPDDE